MFSLPVHKINFARKDQWPQKQKSTGSLNKAWQHERFAVSQSFSSPLLMKAGELPQGKKKRNPPSGLQVLHIQGKSGSALHRHGKSTAAPQGILWPRRGDKIWGARGFQGATRRGIGRWSHRNTLLSDDTGLEHQPLPAAFPCQLSLPGWVSASGNEGALQCFTSSLSIAQLVTSQQALKLALCWLLLLQSLGKPLSWEGGEDKHCSKQAVPHVEVSKHKKKKKKPNPTNICQVFLGYPSCWKNPRNPKEATFIMKIWTPALRPTRSTLWFCVYGTLPIEAKPQKPPVCSWGYVLLQKACQGLKYQEWEISKSWSAVANQTTKGAPVPTKECMV